MPDPFGRRTVFVLVRALCGGDGLFTSFREIKFVRSSPAVHARSRVAGATGAGELHQTTWPGRPGG